MLSSGAKTETEDRDKMSLESHRPEDWVLVPPLADCLSKLLGLSEIVSYVLACKMGIIIAESLILGSPKGGEGGR